MKRLALSMLAFALFVVGCSQKGGVYSSGNTTVNEGRNESKNWNNSGNSKGGFATVEDKMTYIDGNLKSVFFNFGQFNIRPDMQKVIDNNVDVLRSPIVGDLSVRIEGNTDEWGTDEYNYALGLKRAVAVRDALVAKGVSRSKTVLISYGESKPTCTNQTKECWAENRKVTFKILP